MSRKRTKDQTLGSLKSKPKTVKNLQEKWKLTKQDSSCSQMDLTHRKKGSQQERHHFTEQGAYLQDVNFTHENYSLDAAYSRETQENPVSQLTTCMPGSDVGMELNSQGHKLNSQGTVSTVNTGQVSSACSVNANHDSAIWQTNWMPRNVASTEFNSQCTSYTVDTGQDSLIPVTNWMQGNIVKVDLNSQGTAGSVDTGQDPGIWQTNWMPESDVRIDLNSQGAACLVDAGQDTLINDQTNWLSGNAMEMDFNACAYSQDPVIGQANWMSMSTAGRENSACSFETDKDFVTQQTNWMPESVSGMDFNSQGNTCLIKSAQDTVIPQPNWMSKDVMKMDFNSHYAACEANYRQDPVIRQTILMPGSIVRTEFNTQDATCSDPVAQGTNWIPGSAMTTPFNSQDASCSGNSKQYPVYDVSSNWSYSPEDPHALKTGTDWPGHHAAQEQYSCDQFRWDCQNVSYKLNTENIAQTAENTRGPPPPAVMHEGHSRQDGDPAKSGQQGGSTNMFWKVLYKCIQCGASICSQAGLKRHMRFHANERTHRCNRCAASFRSADKLRQHLLTHNND